MITKLTCILPCTARKQAILFLKCSKSNGEAVPMHKNAMPSLETLAANISKPICGLFVE